MKTVTGMITDIQRCSMHDGPGIRTTVFLKGCPLSCLWCHNPECRTTDPQVAFYKTDCIGCGRCLDACKNDAIIKDDSRVDRTRCVVCGECAKACTSEALQILGRRVGVSEILDVVMRDEPFYRTSGGGVTLSGGEPLYQNGFSLALLTSFREKGLHTAVETCGYGVWGRVAEFVPLTDLFLYDIKVIDEEKHKKFCGVDNSIILSNARRLVDISAKIIFRTPLVPGLNDTPEDLKLLAEFILSLPGRHKLELIPYHRIGTSKYQSLGIDYPITDCEAPDHIDRQKAMLESMGVDIQA